LYFAPGTYRAGQANWWGGANGIFTIGPTIRDASAFPGFIQFDNVFMANAPQPEGYIAGAAPVIVRRMNIKNAMNHGRQSNSNYSGMWVNWW